MNTTSTLPNVVLPSLAPATSKLANAEQHALHEIVAPSEHGSTVKLPNGKPKSEQVQDELATSGIIDPTQKLFNRPILGTDIEPWRLKLGITEQQAQTALGITTPTAYQQLIKKPEPVSFTTEVLVRLYMIAPCAPGWSRYTFKELFDELYREELLEFTNHAELLRSASVVFATRFTKMFDRSKSRAYKWFAKQSLNGDNAEDISISGDIAAILCKLKAMNPERQRKVLLNNPARLFEKIVIFVWRLRGVEFDMEYPVPTLRSIKAKRKRIDWDNPDNLALWVLLSDDQGNHLKR